MNSHTQDLKNYFDQIEKGVKEAYTLAEQARKKGHRNYIVYLEKRMKGEKVVRRCSRKKRDMTHQTTLHKYMNEEISLGVDLFPHTTKVKIPQKLRYQNIFDFFVG